MKNNLDNDISNNIDKFKKAAEDCDDIVIREFYAYMNKNVKMCIIYADNLADSQTVNNFIMTNLMLRNNRTYSGKDMLDDILMRALAVGEAREIYDYDALYDSVLIGDTVLMADGADFAVSVSTKDWPTRGVPSAESEVVVEGPKDAFNESVSTNTVLLRRRIRDMNFKIKRYAVGDKSSVSINIAYMKGIVRKSVLDRVTESIKNISVDFIPDSGFLAQIIEDNKITPFPQVQLTERPDRAAWALLNGQVVVLVDNTPFAIILPVTINVFFQAAEDYYEKWGIVSLVRIIRYIAAFFAVSLPALYIAFTLYHPQLIPASLALKIAATRQNIPFPTVIEVLIMELAFELLREAGIRLPAPVSSTIGIVGGIIIGQAAVEAGIVGPVIVILSALTGICTFVIPVNSFVSGIRLFKYVLIMFSAVLGIYGFVLGMIFLMAHLASLKSFGIPYLYPFCSASVNDYSDLKDSFFRAPLFMLNKRGIFSDPKARKRYGGKR